MKRVKSIIGNRILEIENEAFVMKYSHLAEDVSISFAFQSTYILIVT